ncbi:hypothetical protein BDV38DRAFT_268588 [Aspergillus pseudotamarii]|uniref:GS catalytic domain-containing protein n=1 Tax=Aspergillus pseudotamarii TaxID=132259 RepID=A0A5N6T517_ASPPS|nr:uncharacterized protein BDV38DRAFT_268588 [Aspergillus pseudotamarii]KAE8141339.1 hypothetical protein BDV38DRAFT_268588 [Aspergillus pseudotamarii]
MQQPHVHCSLFSAKNASLVRPEIVIREARQKNTELRFVRFQWQDHSGILRGRVVPIERCLRLAVEKKLTSMRTGSPSCASGAWYATVMCGVVRTMPDQRRPNYGLYPRCALARVMRKAAHGHDLNLLVGFEVEFEIMKTSGDNSIIPHINSLGRFAIGGLREPWFAQVEECIDELLDAGVGIQSFHTEGRRGQYEISLDPLPPLQAVDELVLVHDRMKRVFSRHGYIATVCPKPVAGRRQAIGQHTHISVHPPHCESSFLAGMLNRLGSLSGDLVAWGTQDREVPIRKMSPGHWEIRCVDATANMYLTLASILSAGILGLIGQEPLAWPDTSLLQEGVNMSYAEPVYLPRTLDVALDLLEANADEL